MVPQTNVMPYASKNNVFPSRAPLGSTASATTNVSGGAPSSSMNSSMNMTAGPALAAPVVSSGEGLSPQSNTIKLASLSSSKSSSIHNSPATQNGTPLGEASPGDGGSGKKGPVRRVVPIDKFDDSDDDEVDEVALTDALIHPGTSDCSMDDDVDDEEVHDNVPSNMSVEMSMALAQANGGTNNSNSQDGQPQAVQPVKPASNIVKSVPIKVFTVDF